MITANLISGVQYYYVTTAYEAPGAGGDGGPFVGNYSNIITGVGQVTLGLVPEPGAGSVFAALAMLGFLRQCKMRL